MKKEYILNISFENWTNQLWFINDDTLETKRQWEESLEEILLLKKTAKDALHFQKLVIEYLENIGFIRVEK